MSTCVHSPGWDLDTSCSSRTPASGNGRETTDILRARGRPRSSPLGPVCATKWTFDPCARPALDGCHSERRAYDENYFFPSAVELAFLTLIAEGRSRCMSLQCPGSDPRQGEWIMMALLATGLRAQGSIFTTVRATLVRLFCRFSAHRIDCTAQCPLPTARGDGHDIRVCDPHAQELQRKLEALEPPVP
jgi:hypothetical protein